jgi:hypothetical protein
MMQIVASANSVYDIPWPQSFRDFLDILKVGPLVFFVRWSEYVFTHTLSIVPPRSVSNLPSVRALCLGPPSSPCQLFLMDVVTVTRASCAQPLDFYQSLLLMLLTFKAVSDRALRVARWLPASGGRDTLPADLTRTFCSTTLYTCTPVSSPLRLISALSTPPPPGATPGGGGGPGR